MKDFSENDFGLSIGDLMAALLLIFILLLGATLLRLETEFHETVRVADTYIQLQDELYDDLQKEFKEDLPKWSAIINRETLGIRFQEPEVLFEPGQDTVRQRFMEILKDFFPRYINLLHQDKYRDAIEEIRIEGHTSSEWGDETDHIVAYFHNMKLSQGRTRNVLHYALSTIEDEELQEWAKYYVIASGLSSSRLIIIDEIEDKELSRRVEFRVRTNAEKRLYQLFEMVDWDIN